MDEKKREELAGLLTVLPPVEFCCVYGSTLHPNNHDKSRMIDYILGVRDPIEWHSLNLKMNKNHYALWMEYLGGAKLITEVADEIGVGVHFNPFVSWNNKMFKYGVVRMHDLVEDVLNWERFYLTGRLQKPVHVLVDSLDIKHLNSFNLRAATSAALLLIPSSFTEEDLYAKICSLSYMGDLRMLFAEDKQKVKKIVQGQFDLFRNMYKPVLEEFAAKDLLRFSSSSSHQENISQKMKQEEVDCCQIQEWYPKFKPVSIKTFIHELPEPFIQYLLEDSGPFLLPTSVTNDDAFPNRIHKPEDEEDFQVLEGSDDESEQPTPPPSFPELELKIKDSIESLGGAVFPKLNWSSPKDTAWISPTGTLKCTSFSDIALLLRSSDSLVHDLCHAYDACSDKTLSRPPHFYLALRKWYPSLRPEMEFRCFVHSQRLVGISQREVTAYYPVLFERKDELEVLLHDFFIDNVEGRFGSENYTFDVYVTKDGRVKLMDFNPWCAFTLPLLFTWEDLEQNAQRKEDIDFRIVENQCSVRPGLKTAVPYDYIDMSPGSGWEQFLRSAGDELQQQMRSPEAGA